jgi:hypothetical protein
VMTILGQWNSIEAIAASRIQDTERCALNMTLEIGPCEGILELTPRCLLLG